MGVVAEVSGVGLGGGVFLKRRGRRKCLRRGEAIVRRTWTRVAGVIVELEEKIITPWSRGTEQSLPKLNNVYLITAN